MDLAKALISGAAGAVALTAMHECTRTNMPDPPRADVLGMEAIEKAADALDASPPEHLRTTALAGDLVGNTLFYSSVGFAGPGQSLLCGALAGIAAGGGVLALPRLPGLSSAAVNRTRGTQAMAAGMYFAAGLIAGAVHHLLSARDRE